jgi:hypothetical protein
MSTTAKAVSGITAQAFSPLVTGAVLIPKPMRMTSYSHTITDGIGFDRATITLTVPNEDGDQWFEEGLGRHIVTYDYSGEVAFEGFVNIIRTSLASLQVSIGPLVDVINRASVVYSTIDTSVEPPAVGTRDRTDVADEATSQAKYGVIQRVLSVGGATLADAEEYRDLILIERSMPGSEKTVSTSSRDALSITLDILGYYHWLDIYVYNDLTGGTVAVSSNTAPLGKLQNVLTADPNGFISTDFTRLAANSDTVSSWEDEDRTASQIVRTLVKRGISGSEAVFGIYEDRKPFYAAIPTSFEYIYRARSNDQRVRGYTVEQIISGALVRPSQWLFLADFLPDRGPPPSGDLEEDRRSMFLDTVDYTWPETLMLRGRNVTGGRTLLSRLGLGSL